jgi:exopolysaccharide/PEP-CTERM locus tyrosine autokinase
MGKFDEALKKAEAAKNSTAVEPVTSKVVEISPEEIDALKVDTSALAQAPAALSPSAAGEVDPRLISLLDPQSPVSEQFKLLRAKLFCNSSVCRGKTIMVTSSQSYDGKSTVAANLAVTIAQGINEYVLLVDCDLRQPSLHQLFGVRNRGGLREYLENGTSIAQYLVKTQLSKLTLLPAGQPPFNPSELLSSEKMRQLIKELRDRYEDRYLILDSTPAGFAAETNFLSTMVDGAILVVRSDKTSRNSIMESIEHIGREKILGVVFNASKEKHRKYRSYYRYYQKDKA